MNDNTPTVENIPTSTSVEKTQEENPFAGLTLQELISPSRREGEDFKIFKLRRAASNKEIKKRIKKGFNLFFDSYHNGTYRKDGKQIKRRKV